MDANTLMQLARGQVGATQQQAVNVSDVYRQQQDIFEQAAALQTTNDAGHTPEMVRVAGIAELEAQRRTQAVASAMGLSTNLQADLQVMLAQDWMQNTLASRDSAQQIAQKESVGLLDNPLEYLYNQFTLQDDYAVYDGQMNAAAQAKQSMADLDSRVAAAKVTASNIATKVTDKTIADQLQAAENEIKIKKLDYQNKILGNEASRLEKVYSLGKDQMASYMNMYNIANTEESKQMQREQFARMVEQDNDRRQAKADKVAEEAEILADIHRGEMYAYGGAVTSPQAVRMHFGKGSPIGLQQQALYQEGQRLRLRLNPIVHETITGRTVRFANEPFEVKNDAQRDVIKAQLTAVATIRDADKSAKPEVVEQKAAALFDTQWKQWNRVIDPKDQTNPLAQLPLAALVNIPSLKESSGWKQYMVAKQDKMDAPFDAAEFHSFLAAGVAAGTVKLEDAVGALSMAGNSVMLINNEANRFEYLTGKTQKEYKTVLQVGNPLGFPSQMLIGGPLSGLAMQMKDTMLIDITKPEEARRAILKALPMTMKSFSPSSIMPGLNMTFDNVRKGANE